MGKKALSVAFLDGIVQAISGVLLDYLLIFLLVGTGVYYTVRLKFVQVRYFGLGIKKLFGSFSFHGGKQEGGLTSFQALATAIAAQVGTGNIAGAATAIASGGPGAIFWMWVSAFFGMSTIYAEAVIAQKTKKELYGKVVGGPAFYIQEAIKGNLGKFLAGFFSIAIILALGFAGNMVQANSIGAAFNSAFGVNPILVGVACALIAGFIFIGGIQRIASVTEKVVPIMALFYVIGCLAILVMCGGGAVAEAFREIFVSAFAPQSAAGGALGVTVQQAIHYGVARGLFSNEAGMGSTPHAHATAKVNHPADQGVIAMIGVFIDTFIILTMTALVIVATGAYKLDLTGAALSQAAFNSQFGDLGMVFIAICMLFFAFTTIIGWYYFGETNVRRLFGEKAIKVYALLVVGFVLVGSAQEVDFVWHLSDMLNGFMVLPNLVGLLASSAIIIKLSKDFDKKQNTGRE